MFFYLRASFPLDHPLKVVELEKSQQLPRLADNTLYVQAGLQKLERLSTPGGELLVLGDPVWERSRFSPQKLSPGPGRFSQQYLYKMLRGHYYWFFRHRTGCYCGSSFGAIFPVYYSLDDGFVALSSASFVLAEQVEAKTPDTRNLLERLLFNYPFFDSTWWKEIRLLTAHRFLSLSKDGAQVGGTFDLRHYMDTPQDASRRSLRQLGALFEEEAGLFFPAEHFAVSLTGGFDGRTLVAAARRAGRQFLTYSFGRKDSWDITFPEAITQKLAIPYLPIYLEQDYLETSYLDSSFSFMNLTEYNGNLGRPHYHHAARLLSSRVKYILTGNFGSELFRALHLPGVMMSECLIRYFAARDDSWKDFLQEAVAAWDKDFFREDAQSLIADLEDYRAEMSGWEPNARLYFFVINDLFRKYFGPELIMQSRYLNNRTPFLSLPFLQALNRTAWSGLHSQLFEKRKIKRMKGQLFYASFLRMTDRALYRMPTSKGYSPADVLEPWRLPALAARFLLRKMKEKDTQRDGQAGNAGFKLFHRRLLEAVPKDGLPLFMQKLLAGSSADISHGEKMEWWIKFYSITLGWQQAHTGIQAKALSHQHSQTQTLTYGKDPAGHSEE